jgi:phosphoglucomutase
MSEATFSRDYKDNNKIKVVYTAHHGAASFVAEELLKDKLNYDVIKVKEQCFYDTLFINSPYPNPEDEKSFDLALEYAEKNNANIILGFDPDADRLGIVVKHKDK